MDTNPIEGILRALTIVCCQAMPSSSLFQTEQKETDTGTSYPALKVRLKRMVNGRGEAV